MVNFLCNVCGRYFDENGNEIHSDNVYEMNFFTCDDCKEEIDNEEEEGE